MAQQALRQSRDLLTASKWFFRGLKHGDWLWLVIAIFMASLSVTVIKQLGDSIQLSMLTKAADSLGADLVLSSSQPIDEKWQQKAQAQGLKTRKTVSVVTMALANNQFQLVSLKGAQPLNPLNLSDLQTPYPPLDIQGILVEQKLLQLLKFPTDTDADADAAAPPITLGTGEFYVRGQLVTPNLLNPMAQFAPQVLMTLAEFEKTKLLGPGSRATYTLELSGSPNALKDFQQQLTQAIKTSETGQNTPLPWTLISAKAPSEDLGKTLDQAWLFLDLASLSAVFIAGMSILIASRFYLQRWQNTMALLRAYGANNQQMLRLFAGQFLWLSLLSSLLGSLIGLLIAWFSQPYLGDFFDPWVMAPAWPALITGVLSGVIVLWGFAWGALSEAIQTSPMRLLRAVPKTQGLSQWALSFVLLMSLITLMVGMKLAIWVFLGLAIIGSALWLASQGLIWAMRIWQSNAKGWLKIAISSLLKEPKLLSIQLISMGVVLFALLLMTFVRQDLLQTWQNSLPEDMPNTFVMNVQPDQLNEAQALLQNNHLTPDFVAMARARLTMHNNQILQAEQMPSPRARRLLQREGNIALMQTPPKYNVISQRLPESQFDRNLQGVSVEAGIAQLFRIQLGDSLTFDFQGTQRTYQVRSLRQVDWQSFRLNFFFIVEPNTTNNPTNIASSALEQNIAISYITNFHYSGSTSALTQGFADQVPGALVIPVQEMIKQIKDIMNQASWGVTALFSFTLVASILVLFTATLASQQNRLQSWFLLRSLGATQKTIFKVGLSEFILIGMLAGLIAALFAQASSLLISYLWFERLSPFSWGLFLSGLALSVGTLLTVAFLTQYRYLKLSANQLKRLL